MGKSWIVVLFGTLAWAQMDSAEELIRAVRVRSNQAMAAHDLQTLVGTLTEDFVQVRGNGMFTGSKALWMDTMRTSFADPKAIGFERTTDKVEVSKLESSKVTRLAAEHGHWTGRKADGAKAFGGTYLAMWRKAGEGWKIRSELFVVLDCYDETACAAYVGK